MSWNQKLVVTDEYEPPFDTIQQGLDYLQKKAKEKQYDAQIAGYFNAQSVTRYAVSQVTQHTDLQTISFALTLVKDKRQASTSSSLIDKSGLDLLFEQAEKSLEAVPEIPFYQGLPDPKKSDGVKLVGNSWDIEERADKVIETVNAGEEIDKSVRLAGTITSQINYSHIISTQGIDVENGLNSNYYKVNAILGSPDARGYGQEELYWRFDAPNVSEHAKEATQTAKDTIELKTFEPGEYEVLLGPKAVSDLVNYVQFSCEPVSYHEGNSFTSDRLGDQIFDPKLTIHDLPRDARKANFVRNFDGEGISSQNRVIFDKGSLVFIPYDSFTGAKYLEDKDAATGNAGGSWFGGPFLGAAVLEEGDRSIDQQISEMENGLYVKNFWYNRFTLRREGGLTGLTRNGVYHVENGELKGTVRNFRYTESFVKAFSEGNVLSLSNDPKMFQLNTCPAMHLEKYNFSSIAHTAKL